MRGTPFLRGAAVAGIVALGGGLLAGCGGGSSKKSSSGDAKLTLAGALAATFAGTAVTATTTLTGSSSDLAQTLQAVTGKAATPAQVTAISGMTITYATASTNGKPLPQAGTGNSDSEVAVTTPSGTALDVRSLGPQGTIYAQVDTGQLGTLLGHPLNVTSLQALAAKPGLAFVGDALAGKWVGLSGLSTLTGLLSFGAAPVTAAPNQGGVMQQFLATVAKDTTAVDKGSTSKGEDFQIAANAKQLATDFSNVFLAQPGATLLRTQIQGLLGKVPDKPVTVHAYVQGGKLTRVEADLSQVATGAAAAHPVPLAIDLKTSAGAITAPAGAEVVQADTLVSAASSLLNLGSLLGGTKAP